MKAFDEIQQLWNRQPPEPRVSYDTILKRVRSSKNAIATKLLWQCVSIGVAIASLILIAVLVNFFTWTAYLAVLIMVSGLLYYLVNQIQDYRRINNSEHRLDKPQDYIDYLQEFQRRRNRFNTYNYTIYEICLGVAFALYGVELYFLLPLWVFIGFMAFVVFWFVLTHQVFMKQYIKAENARIEELVSHLERIKEQFSDDPAV